MADHALVSGQIPRITDFETALVDGLPVSATAQAARIEVGAAGSICGDVAHFQPTLTESAQGDMMGGIHLAAAPDALVAKTADAFQ